MSTDPTPAPTPRRPLIRRLLVGGAFAATFLAGGLVFSGAAAGAAGMAMAHCGMGGGATAGPGSMHTMMGAHIDKMLSAVDATPDQRGRIQAILKTAMGSMGPIHERMAAGHGELHRLLAAPVTDRAALEQLRAARVADVDQASRVLVGALADAAQVLSPSQRARLAQHMAPPRS